VSFIYPGPEFRTLVTSFAHTAFRLETRDAYNSPAEAEAFESFKAGQSIDLAWFQGWLNMVRDAAVEGRTFSRVWVVSLPPTDYTRFGLWGARYTRESGDDIRYLTRAAAEAAGLPAQDYWLFDSRTLVRMHFADDDRFIHAEVVNDPAAIVDANHWRDAARHHALAPDEFTAQHGLRVV
jgi:hypothetical protein